jgi:hypothetical protein
VAFAATAVAAVEFSASMEDQLWAKVYFSATGGFGNLPSLCLVVAASLILVERLSWPLDEPVVRVVAGLVLASAASPS